MIISDEDAIAAHAALEVLRELVNSRRSSTCFSIPESRKLTRNQYFVDSPDVGIFLSQLWSLRNALENLAAVTAQSLKDFEQKDRERHANQRK